MNSIRRLAGGAAVAFAAVALALPAYADGMRGSMKDKPAEPRRCTFSANAALTTDYVFRGFSQTSDGPAVQGGFDATCGMFYAGVWASSLDWGTIPTAGPDTNAVNIEMDWYGGVKFNTGKVAWDLGIIYYSYPNSASNLGTGPAGRDPNYVEFKVGASSEIWKGGTLGGTVFYSPDYQLETGAVWTFEGSFSQTLPTIMGRITPTFSALVGYQVASDDKTAYIANVTGDDNKYMYWNAGVTFALDKNWSVDVRYWDTNINGSSATCTTSAALGCDERVVGTLKFTY